MAHMEPAGLAETAPLVVLGHAFGPGDRIQFLPTRNNVWTGRTRRGRVEQIYASGALRVRSGDRSHIVTADQLIVEQPAMDSRLGSG